LLSGTFSSIETDVPRPFAPKKTILVEGKGGPSTDKRGKEEKKLFHPMIVSWLLFSSRFDVFDVIMS
jgi:hypothetical protein